MSRQFNPKRGLKRERRERTAHLSTLGVPFHKTNRPIPLSIKTETKDYIARNRILRDLGYPNYGVYLKSELWAFIRRRVLSRDSHLCFLCGHPAWMVHHIHYSRAVLLGHDLTPLLAVCKPCHDKIEHEPDGKKRSLEGAARAIGVELETHPPRADGGPGTPTSAELPNRNANTTRPRSDASKSGVR